MAKDQRYRLENRILSEYSNGSGKIDRYEYLHRQVEESLIIHEPKVTITPVHFKKLIYLEDATGIPITRADGMRIIGLILRTRGLSRWLCFNLFSKDISELERSYFISRLTLFLLMFRHRRTIGKQIRNHIRYVSKVEGFDNVLTVTQNDYFSAISGAKMNLPALAILSTQGNFQPESKTVRYRGDETSTLVPQLMENDAMALLQLLLEFGANEQLLDYLKNNYPDALVYLDSHKALKVVRMENAERTFDQIAIGQGFKLEGDILENVMVWHQRFLISENRLFEFDQAGSHRLPFVAGHWQYTIGSKIVMDKVFIKAPVSEIQSIPEAIFLSNRADENWFHLLMDTLPRYLFLKDLAPQIPVLIRADLPLTTKEFLHKVLGRQIVELSPNSIVNAEKLHLLAARSTCFDSISDENETQVSFSPLIIKMLVEWIGESLGVMQVNNAMSSGFFKRGSRQRRILNSGRIEKEALKKGLQIIEDNENTYRNQISIFSRLRFAVIPGGAMLANMIFMKPGSTVLCLRGSRQNDLDLWKKLAEAVGLNYFEIAGPPSYHGRNKLQRDHSNYFISSRKFRRTLSEVMRSIT